jgi:hypothetical protein
VFNPVEYKHKNHRIHLILCDRKCLFTNSTCCLNSVLFVLNLSDPTSNLVRQYNFPFPHRCRKTSDTVFVAFGRPLSELVRRFSSCSTDFSQQIAQVVLFLLLHVFLFQNCGIITSNPPTSFPPKTNKSWGVCGWQKIWIGKS